MIAEIYWIRAEHHSDITSEGYIGVSKNSKKRWLYGHKWGTLKGRHANCHLSNAINKYGWNSLLKTIILIGDENYCYEIEKKLRPVENIGWNLAVGGHKPPVAKFRGENYISPLKGVSRPTPWLVGKNKIGRPLSEAAKAKVSAFQKGRKQSLEQIAKRVASRKATLESQGRTR